ncbi:MAG: PEP-CTERM sorting domain-containing protein [Deltaproteobacteria bacterium]|nr:PEP-CTERM sorting domain-containing protein [Deltaproteobacteria bacterium]
MLGLLAAPLAARATILTFDESRNGNAVEPTGSGSQLGSDYGDNVTAASMAVLGGVYTYGEAGEGFTPDVSVDIRSSLDSTTDPGVRLWQRGYGDLVNVVFSEGPGTAGAPLLFVRLTAAPGFVVDLHDFDLAHSSPVATTIAGVSVLDGETTLFSAANVLVAGSTSTPGRTTFSFPMPLSAVELLVRIDVSNLSPGAQDNIGLDNLRFGQTPPGVVPEPGTALLIFLGLAGLAARRLGDVSGP